ncbi:hypothetical protein THAOC_15727, partial [Thalassiosira oceanica]
TFQSTNITMATRPLYPLYGAGGGAGGSFDDMSIGLGKSADELSDLGSQGASVLGSRASGGGPSPTRSWGSPQRRGLGAAPLASSDRDGSARDGSSDAPSYPSSRPSHNQSSFCPSSRSIDEVEIFELDRERAESSGGLVWRIGGAGAL